MLRALALLCLVLPVLATPALAQTEIHRCIGANSGAVFTDQACSALKATPVSPAAAAAIPSPVAAPPPVLCAASVGELRQSVIDAFARRDTIRMAGLVLWDGYGRSAAIADIRALSALMKQPRLEVETAPQQAASTAPLDDDFFAQNSPPPTPPTMEQLVLHTAGDGSAARTWRFDIVSRAGCQWLRNAH
ncbi:MAG: DUF4124 domain-containing protein [Rhodanobacter sp.]|nr:MAG: DUF4124 domain-containing protein [Rhodanobacter sp.]TAM04199.1 MAG: DUF4124 domain-containing protein [Rhodanobacter sp.]TAM42305.1 MAG: DUF4124 domain-containing protein [Rhodanobacter sp.]TAN29030.1 MAG: DUF4124 domain-containing protein [Rhodanobacter sp.]